MKKYEAPELLKTEIKIEDVLSVTFTENGEDGTTTWLSSWTSQISNKNNA